MMQSGYLGSSHISSVCQKPSAYHCQRIRWGVSRRFSFPVPEVEREPVDPSLGARASGARYLATGG